MNFLSITGTLLFGAAALACQVPKKPDRAVTEEAKLPDTVLIDARQLSHGTRFDSARNPLSRHDAARITGPDSVLYRADTLAVTPSASIVLIGRLYVNETIGWLVTVDRSSHRLIDRQMVYYDNAEGLSQTQTSWLPRQQRAIVQNSTYDETGNARTSRITYAVLPTGKLSKLN